MEEILSQVQAQVGCHAKAWSVRQFYCTVRYTTAWEYIGTPVEV